MEFETLAAHAEHYAKERHRATSQMYDDKHPYEYHLTMVAARAARWAHLLPESERDLALAIAWVHDLIEDARVTYNDVRAVLGTDVADGAYALTQEKGRTRAERECPRYFAGIRKRRVYIFAKLCDRGANIQYGVENPNPRGMLRKYKRDTPEFLASLGPQRLSWLHDFLPDSLCPLLTRLGVEPDRSAGLEPMFAEIRELVAQ